MSMRTAVPFHSQYGDDVPEKWRAHACTIANLKMVLDFLGVSPQPTIAELLTEGESMRGFGPRGWTHDAIVYLLHNHGVRAYREEFRSRDETVTDRFAHEGVEKIRAHTDSGMPVLTSIEKPNGSYHTVLVIGMRGDMLMYHDPEVGPDQQISADEFLKHWKRLAIFVY